MTGRLDELMDRLPPSEFSLRVKENAAEIGHNNWLKDTSAILGFPNKQKFDVRDMRTGAMPYKTMKFLSELVVLDEKQEARVNIDIESFETLFIDDMKELGFSDEVIENDLAYIRSLAGLLDTESREEALLQFQGLVNEAAFKRIHDNDTWGKAAEAFMKIYEVDSYQFSRRFLKYNFIYAIQEALEHIDEVKDLKDVNSFKEFFKKYPAVRFVMLAAHHSWREREFEQKYNIEIKMFDLGDRAEVTTDAVRRTTADYFGSYRIGLIGAIYSRNFEKQRIQSIIHELREAMHKSEIITTEQSFTLMLSIAEDVEKRIIEIEDGADYEARQADLKVLTDARNDLLGTMTFDANIAIPLSLKKTYTDMNGADSFPTLQKID